jgi:hypothetical protein
VPRNKAHVPIDELEPHPLVRFEAAHVPLESRPAKPRRPRKPKPIRHK